MKKESKKNKTIAVRVSEDMFLKLKENNIDVAKITREALERALRVIPLILLVLTSCAEKDFSEKYIDQELEPYFLEYKYEAQRRGVEIDDQTLTMIFATDDRFNDGKLGMCYVDKRYHLDSNRYKIVKEKLITIKRSTWENLTETGKKILVFHELTHCTLGQGHRGGNIGQSNYSLMTHLSTPLKDDIYLPTIENNWNALLDEMFLN